MIRSPLGLRINPSRARNPKDQLREAARLGAKGVILDATGDLAPDRLTETGRRDLRHTLRTLELSLIGLHLPTRRSFDTEDQLDERLARAASAFILAYELGTELVLARVGALPPESETDHRETFTNALEDLGQRADHRGVRLTLETGTETGADLRAFLDALDLGGLAASIEPAALQKMGFDPVAATRDLGPWVAHAYADESNAHAGPFVAQSRGAGSSRGVLDWDEYLGALEEIAYAGYITIWPDPTADQSAEFQRIKERLDRV